MKPSLRPLASTAAVALAAAWVAAANPALAQDTASPVTRELPASPCTPAAPRASVWPRCPPVHQHHAGLPACIARCAKPAIHADPAVRVGRIQCAYRRPRRGGRLCHPLDGRIRELEDQIAAVKAEAAFAATGGRLPEERGCRRCWHRNARRPPASAPRPHRSPPPPTRYGKSAHESQTRAHQLQRKQEALELALEAPRPPSVTA